ncbi:TetR/AcrR family transcriptional regulator [Microlunatus parietis]|uniref:AcrR family transcriptional regulator n=1 Tax=Microlunatus parietis TaxID=682979 RepID=A0A7Y9IB54_9ACTN|nr:TetR/AcrR family transcriptional regulator [Microlunatus parietis]NYE73599.1 AcrR family transcriptional regulator [Microlunatus parietis]
MAVQRGILNVGAIIEHGIALADAGGLDAVSMRAIAERLGTGVMSLYRHVPNKEALIGLMVDTVSDRYSYPDHSDLDWRQSLTVLARTDWAMYLDHPWTLVASATSRPPVGPSTVRAMEWAYSAIAELGLSAQDTTGVIMAVTVHVQGVARQAIAERRLAEATGVDAAEWWRQQLTALDSGDHPLLEPIVQGFVEGDTERWLEFDLKLILDGVERRAAR